MNVRLQVVELEPHTLYGMMDVGRGVTKDRRTYLIHAVHTRYVGLAQARPNDRIRKMLINFIALNWIMRCIRLTTVIGVRFDQEPSVVYI